MMDLALEFTAGVSFGEARQATNEQLHNSWIIAAMCLTTEQLV